MKNVRIKLKHDGHFHAKPTFPLKIIARIYWENFGIW
jgi:hypothetical protein